MKGKIFGQKEPDGITMAKKTFELKSALKGLFLEG